MFTSDTVERARNMIFNKYIILMNLQALSSTIEQNYMTPQLRIDEINTFFNRIYIIR